MKKILNSKGMTIVEIILAIGLVSIVMVQVLNLLVDLKSEQVLGESKTKDLSNRSLIMKRVEEDFVNRVIISVDDCPLTGKINNRTVYSMKSCVKVLFSDDNKPHFLITAKNTENDYDYFIYGYSDISADQVPTVYEAWKLETGRYPDGVCLRFFDCSAPGNNCNSNYFALQYPVILSEAMSNSTMNFDLEFIYYFRSSSVIPNDFGSSESTSFWNKHREVCK